MWTIWQPAVVVVFFFSSLHVDRKFSAPAMWIFPSEGFPRGFSEGQVWAHLHVL